jgi:hypothetical protein
MFMTVTIPINKISHNIGVEGGFSDQEPEYDETFEIVILPEFISLPFPSVDLPEKVLSIDYVKIEAVICTVIYYMLQMTG